MATVTPMMQNYLDTKEKYKDCILFYRLGDFYEMFFDDAITVSKELELTLTGKDCGLEERAPMCGIPHHAANTYIPKLVEKGYKVAICEQLEDPKQAKGIVKRDVVKIVTPGTITELTMLDEKRNNYIASLFVEKKQCAISFCDISTGEFFISSIGGVDVNTKILNEISRIAPSEIILTDSSKENLAFLNEFNRIFDIYISTYNNMDSNSMLDKIVKKHNVELNNVEEQAATLLLNYIEDTQKSSIEQINNIEKYEIEKYMQLDTTTRKNLEILEANREKTKKGSLLWVLDETVTAMGGRALRHWLESPLLDKNEIIKRQDAVGVLVDNNMYRDELQEVLKSVYDIERLISKVVGGSVNARELTSLKNSLQKLPTLKVLLKQIVDKTNDVYFTEFYNTIDTLDDVYTLIDKAIVEDAGITIKEGGIIKDGFSTQVDEYRMASTKGQEWLMELEAKEKELTGIKGKWLRIGYNRVFGYYIEVTNSYKSQIPEDRYIRKQTLAGAERYVTEELKEIEEKILGAKEKLVDIEYDLFCKIREEVALQVIRIQKTAAIVSILDVLSSFATVAVNNSYVKPEITEDGVIDIKNGRHAVVEKALKNEQFIPNDSYLSNTDDRFLIITGPNMAGKSTYMRQVALITYMAQLGCFVPADSAKISIVDRIFTRIGASDDLAMGQSTFMVEMQELSNILENATKNSLLILDEIGRGTSTYDGLAIAWATVEYIADLEKVGAKTLFATHYHELIELEEKIPGVKNYSVDVKEKGDEVIFLRKITPGGADESYGIYVAKLAGVKKPVISRAKEILKYLENIDLAKKTIDQKKKKITTEEVQVDMFNYKMAGVVSMLEKIDLDELTPKDALEVLYKLKEKLD
ncbi:MAG: DNA mismatch repair protein MutS [Clostridia bacterium]|nr:DNA mismatch repair protein MutS [Clostridia bacterium]